MFYRRSLELSGGWSRPTSAKPDFSAGALTALGVAWIAIISTGFTNAAPCYDCEEYRKHGEALTDPYGLVRGRCSYPCECSHQVEPLTCPLGVILIRDGCGCCTICAKQKGQSCDMVELCDENKGLECVYPMPTSTSGTCKVRQGRGCEVGGHLYSDGETFKLDCRTQCTCQNGTYGCVSLCPHENIRPSGKCRNPQLVRIHGACCRDWLCESSLWEHREPSCARYSTPWSPCSSNCDPGLSFRITNDNLECSIRNETRICQVRPCDPKDDQGQLGDQLDEKHSGNKPRRRTVRRRHVCRATVKSNFPIRLTDGQNCTSVKSYQSKFCANCQGKVCSPRLATTLRVDFECPSRAELVPRDVMWIVKCVCEDIPTL